MNSPPEYQTRRTVRYSAISYLLEKGYNVMKVHSRQSPNEIPIHLVAWNQRDLFFICTRLLRFANRLQEDINRLSTYVRSGHSPCEVQYWYRGPEHWTRYRIYPGGAVQIPEGDDIAG